MNLVTAYAKSSTGLYGTGSPKLENLDEKLYLQRTLMTN